MLILYELSSYYLFVSLFLLSFHIYHLKGSTPKLTAFATALETSAFCRWRRTYLQKLNSVIALLLLNLVVLVLMASTQRRAFSQGWFLVFQSFVLILFLIALRREYVCLEPAPFYSFGSYFLLSFLYLAGFSLLYAVFGEYCYSMNCVVSGQGRPSSCQFCKIIPVFDSSIEVKTEDSDEYYALNSLGLALTWTYISLSLCICLYLLVLQFCVWRRPPSEREIFEEYITTKHLDESLQED